MNSLLYIYIGKVHISKILKWKAHTVESKTYNIILGPYQSIFSLLCQLILKKTRWNVFKGQEREARVFKSVLDLFLNSLAIFRAHLA